MSPVTPVDCTLVPSAREVRLAAGIGGLVARRATPCRREYIADVGVLPFDFNFGSGVPGKPNEGTRG